MDNTNTIPQFLKPGKKWLIFFGAALGVLVISGLIFSLYAVCQIYLPADRSNAAEQEFLVAKGLGVKEIAANLEKDKLINSAFWFETYIWYKRQAMNLQAGNYALSPTMNTPKIVDIITGGKVLANEARLTFPEGFTRDQIKTRLAEAGVVSAQELGAEKAGDFQIQYKFLKDVSQQASLEGFLFPDTYIFEKDTKKEEVVKKFLDNFDKKLTPEMREEISRQGRKLFEVVILASIVQQEAVDEKEMPLIAGVFWNRLQIGMLLQSDATVNYATGKKLRQPTAQDINIASPYNTYINKGLPPGPICNPGQAAIRAAISPAETDYLYFLHPLDASAVFSKTLDEHNRNRAKWLK